MYSTEHQTFKPLEMSQGRTAEEEDVFTNSNMCGPTVRREK